MTQDLQLVPVPETQSIPDEGGHYDMDGVSLAVDPKTDENVVVVASDGIPEAQSGKKRTGPLLVLGVTAVAGALVGYFVGRRRAS